MGAAAVKLMRHPSAAPTANVVPATARGFAVQLLALALALSSTISPLASLRLKEGARDYVVDG